MTVQWSPTIVCDTCGTEIRFEPIERLFSDGQVRKAANELRFWTSIRTSKFLPGRVDQCFECSAEFIGVPIRKRKEVRK